MKLKNGNTLYFAQLDMACNQAGTDFADVFEAKDLKEAEDIAFEMVCDFIEMYMPILSDEISEEELEEMEEADEEYMMLCDVGSPSVVLYNPDKHDGHSVSGSFLNRYKDQLA